jgi:Predicted periplasmic protein
MQIEGEINFGDAETFYDLYNSKANTPSKFTHVILKDSKGGSFIDAVNIGLNIEGQGMTTEVEGICFSACAYIWLGGTALFAHPDDRVWIHAPFSVDVNPDGSTGTERSTGPEADAVNDGTLALASWYLGKLEISSDAIIPMLLNTRDKDHIFAFNEDSARAVGININVLSEGKHGR